VAVRNVAEGLDMAETGMARDSRGRKVTDVTAADAVVKTLRFPPGETRRESLKVSGQVDQRVLHSKIRREISEQRALGYFEKDPIQRKAAQDRLAAWNRKNPDQKIVGRPQDIARRVNELGRVQTGQFVRSAPKAHVLWRATRRACRLPRSRATSRARAASGVRSMPFSTKLANYLKRGQFPLKGSMDIPLWQELLSAMEVDPVKATVEAKALLEGKNFWIFADTITVNDVGFKVGGGDLAAMIGAMHAKLMEDFDIYNRKGDTTVQDLAKRVRKIASKNGVVKVSSVQLMPLHGKHKMGTGLTTKSMLTFLPDPALYGADIFGSQPDQTAISRLAPLWSALKKRRHVARGSGNIGRKTHYVLAHLLNHQVNGSGSDPANVVPFYADANTEMAMQVEVHLKDLVHRGVPVSYNIQLEGDVGMTPGRLNALAACGSKAQREVIEAEQYLPAAIVLSLSAQDAVGTWHVIVPSHRIANFVPETVPVI
jgi:hypothetical protein